jgi:hypothetical protein
MDGLERGWDEGFELGVAFAQDRDEPAPVYFNGAKLAAGWGFHDALAKVQQGEVPREAEAFKALKAHERLCSEMAKSQKEEGR